MNNIEKCRKKENAQKIFYNFGLSTLHAWIRFFECLLHIAYRLEFKIFEFYEAVKKLIINVKSDINHSTSSSDSK
jgi:hypothetical protein